uniref:Putative signal transducer n=1 Tax=Amblyomma aureolatum TaxID=187763 RepID=A0A1E1XHR8_9ACAR
MSFPRAPRFTDVAENTPPVGLYNPLLRAHTSAPKFSTNDRFKPGSAQCSSAAFDSFKVPQTPSRLQREKLQRRLHEMTGHLEERDALISKLRASREHLISRIEYLEKTLQSVTRKVSARRESISVKKLQCHESSSGAHESPAAHEATRTLAEVRLSKGTAELKEEIEKLINDFRDDDANKCTIGMDSADLACEKELEHAFGKLCSENERLVSTVSELQCEVKALKNHHEDLEGKHAKLTEWAVYHENEKSKLQKKSEEIMTENKALKENMNCLQAENSRLQSAYSSIALRYEDIESQLDEVSCEDACLRSLLHDRDNEILVLEEHKQDMFEQLGEFKDFILTMIDAEQKLSSRLSDLESLHSRNEELSSMKMNLEQELKTVKDALRALEEEKKITERDFAKLLEDKDVLQENSRAYFAMHAKCEKELSKTRHELEICHSEAKLLSDKNCSLAKELSAAISLHEVTVLKNRELEKLLDSLSNEKNTMEEHVASLTATLKTVEASLNQANAEHLKLTHELSASETEAGNLKKEKVDLLSQVAATEERLKNEQAIWDNLRAENVELQGRLLHLEQKMMMSTKSADELLMEKAHIDGVLLAMIKEKERLEEEVCVIRGRNEELNASKASLQMQLSGALAQLSAAEVCKQGLEEELALTQEAKHEAARDALHKDEALKGLESKNNNLAKVLLEQQKLNSKLEMELASLQVSADLLQVRNAELQFNSDAFKQQLSVSERRANKYKLVCSELDQQKRDLCDQIKQLSEDLTKLRDGQVASLTEQLKDITAEAERWKLNFETLQLRVSPFEDQLALYEMEKELLERRNDATESELSKLHRKVSEMMGHQNHKQKIHYLSNLLKERNEYKKEVYALQEKILKQMKEIKKLEVLVLQRGRKSVLELSTKENLEPPA